MRKQSRLIRKSTKKLTNLLRNWIKFWSTHQKREKEQWRKVSQSFCGFLEKSDHEKNFFSNPKDENRESNQHECDYEACNSKQNTFAERRCCCEFVSQEAWKSKGCQQGRSKNRPNNVIGRESKWNDDQTSKKCRNEAHEGNLDSTSRHITGNVIHKLHKKPGRWFFLGVCFMDALIAINFISLHALLNAMIQSFWSIVNVKGLKKFLFGFVGILKWKVVSNWTALETVQWFENNSETSRLKKPLNFWKKHRWETSRDSTDDVKISIRRFFWVWLLLNGVHLNFLTIFKHFSSSSVFNFIRVLSFPQVFPQLSYPCKVRSMSPFTAQ